MVLGVLNHFFSNGDSFMLEGKRKKLKSSERNNNDF